MPSTNPPPRRLTSRRATTSLVLAGLLTGLVTGVGAPVMAGPPSAPRPVAPQLHTLKLSGVDSAALQGLRASGTGTPDVLAPDALAPDVLAPDVLTAPRRTKPFELVGVTWVAAATTPQVEVAVRTRTAGRWSGWERLELADGLAPGEAADEAAAISRQGTAPYYAGESDGVQVRVDVRRGRLPQDLRADLVDPGESTADAHLTASAPATGSATEAAAATSAPPMVISRAGWGADESLRNGGPRYDATIQAAFVHHTGTGNYYGPDDVAAQLRGIYAYETQSLGYSDMAYNFLVDRFGRIFEGRAGGMDLPVVGAHTGGFNTDTFGVAALGNFDVVDVPSETVRSIAKVVGWKLSLFGRDPLGGTVLTSAGGGTSRYPAGTRVNVRVVSAHRDVGYTACPGQYLFADMSALRSMAKTFMDQRFPSPINKETTFVPVRPTKLFATRTGFGPVPRGRLGPGEQVAVPMRGRAGVPASRAVTAVAVQLTGKSTRGGVLATYPTHRPSTVRTVSLAAGRTAESHVVAKLGDRGRVTFRNGRGDTHVRADVYGYYVRGTSGLGFHPTAPTRVYDTTDRHLPLQPREARRIPLAGVSGIPAGAAAVAVNVVVKKSTARGKVAVYPSTIERPRVALARFAPGQSVRRLAMVGLSRAGNVRLWNRRGKTHVALDVVGWYGPASLGAGDSYVPVRPWRVQAGGSTAPTGRLDAGRTVSVEVAPDTGPVPADATRVVLSLSATRPDRATALTAWEAETPQPALPSLTAAAGTDSTNLVVAPASQWGWMSLANRRGSAGVTVDVVGYFTPRSQ